MFVQGALCYFRSSAFKTDQGKKDQILYLVGKRRNSREFLEMHLLMKIFEKMRNFRDIFYKFIF